MRRWPPLADNNKNNGNNDNKIKIIIMIIMIIIMIIMLVPDKALLRDPADLFFGPWWYLQRHIPLWFFARAHFLVHMYTPQYLLHLRAQGNETRPAACIDSSRRALPGAAWWRPVGGRDRIMITLCSANLPLTCPSPPALPCLGRSAGRSVGRLTGCLVGHLLQLVGWLGRSASRSVV